MLKDTESSQWLPSMLANQRHLFSIPNEIAYLNCAYMSPLMNTVTAAGRDAVQRKAQPWNIAPADFFSDCETARGLMGELTGADPNAFAIIPAVSYGVAIAAAILPISTGRQIVVLSEQFPSNIYAWHELAGKTGAELVTVERPPDGHWTAAIIDAIGEQTAIVALPHCHWTDGGLIDLNAVAAVCRHHGAALVLDLTQSLGALPIDFSQVQPDLAVMACYKWLLGPYSLGFLYVAPQWQSADPLEYGWITRKNSENFSGLVDYQSEFQPGARRFDMGERSNFHLMPMALTALRQLSQWGIPTIADALARKTGLIAERARGLGLLTLADDQRAGHFLGLRFPDGIPAALSKSLAANHVFVSVRGDSVRVTPHVYNTDEDVDRLFDALHRL